MSARSIAHALGLRRAGDEYTGACPCCGYKTGFNVAERDGRLLICCVAGGCEPRDLWATLRKLGLVPQRETPLKRKRPQKLAEASPITVSPKAADDDKRDAIAAIWGRSQPIAGTIGEVYLRARGYSGPIPSSVLRFGYGKHPSADGYHPMIVGAVVLEGRMDQCIALHRTFLKPDGSGKAELEPNKMTLGPSKGGAVPLAPTGPVVAIGEGIESSLSYQQMTGTPTWAGLSAAGIRNAILPPEIQEIVIVVDPDPVGLIAARAAARRWLTEGRRVRIARPPVGSDFNDLLRAAP